MTTTRTSFLCLLLSMPLWTGLAHAGTAADKPFRTGPKDDPPANSPLPVGAIARLGGGGHFQLPVLIRDVVFSPDGQRIAYAGWTKPVERNGEYLVALREAATGKEVRRLSLQATIGRSFRGLRFSPDGKMLAGWNEKTLHVWEVATGRLLLPDGPAGPAGISKIRFSPDGRLLATQVQEPMVRLWDVATGKQVRQLQVPNQKRLIRTMSFSPDWKTLAVVAA